MYGKGSNSWDLELGLKATIGLPPLTQLCRNIYMNNANKDLCKKYTQYCTHWALHFCKCVTKGLFVQSGLLKIYRCVELCKGIAILPSWLYYNWVFLRVVLLPLRNLVTEHNIFWKETLIIFKITLPKLKRKSYLWQIWKN